MNAMRAPTLMTNRCGVAAPIALRPHAVHAVFVALDDRDWFLADRRRRAKLVWNERRSELELDQQRPRRRFRWPYRLRPDLPLWVRRTLRQIPFWALVALGYFTFRALR